MILTCKRKGFTLIELLIVIVVIGILASMMILSSSEARSSAQAAAIIENLHNWKTAAIEWYTDNIDRVNDDGTIDNSTGGKKTFREDGDGIITAKDLLPYLSKGGVTVDSNKDNWNVKDAAGGTYYTDFITYNQSKFKEQNLHYNDDGKEEYAWVVGYHLPNMGTRLKEKLQAKVDAGILIWKKPDKSLQYENADSSKENYIAMMVMSFATNPTD